MARLTNNIPKTTPRGTNWYAKTEFEPFNVDFSFPRIQAATAPRKAKSSLQSGKFGSVKKPSGKSGVRGRSGK